MDHICISVIVPIYGVEQYIERCARSLFEQTMNEGIEYIFVDDCTKDNSIYILNRVLEDYPERRHQVTLLRHDVNKGLPQARKRRGTISLIVIVMTGLVLICIKNCRIMRRKMIMI